MIEPITAQEMRSGYACATGAFAAVASPSASGIIASVAAEHGLRAADLVGREKHRGVSHPRHFAVVRIRDETGLSWAQIGRRMGGRDHTTIMSSYRRGKALLKEGNA